MESYREKKTCPERKKVLKNQININKGADDIFIEDK